MGIFLIINNSKILYEQIFSRRNYIMKINMYVLYGGRSVEHEVSVISARAVFFKSSLFLKSNVLSAILHFTPFL